MIFISSINRTNFLITSVLMRNDCNNGIFSIFEDNAALIASSYIARIIFSISKPMPSLSPLANLFFIR